MKKVAFICVHNSCRSQIAEALGKKLASDVFESFSAGTETKPWINQDAVRLMKQVHNIDMEATQYSKLLSDIPQVDVVITMGCNVQCPLLPCSHREDWGLEDPTGKSDAAFLKTIQLIEEKILDLKQKVGVPMRTIQISDSVFSVDVNKTTEYYKTHTLCDCDYCRNYYAQMKGKFPQLEAFLSQFGIDIAKPDEISISYEMDGCIHYQMIDYTICGKIENIGQSKIYVSDSLPFELCITDGFSSPNEQISDYFTISIKTGFTLPWALEKPIAQQPNRIQKFFQKVFKA